jgi:ABC-type Fe3+/spermidine/putrescine transport system ATPase subunit
VQRGTPQEVYSTPGNVWIARFLGMQNILSSEWVGPGLLQTPIGRLRVNGSGSGPVIAVVRPEAAAVGPSDRGTSITGEIQERSFLGTTVQLIVRFPSGHRLTFVLPPTPHCPAEGESVVLSIQADGIVCLDNGDTIHGCA